MDLNEYSIVDASVKVGAAIPHQVHVYCSHTNGYHARRSQAALGFTLTVVPDHLLRTRYTWGVEFAGNSIWSEGCT